MVAVFAVQFVNKNILKCKSHDFIWKKEYLEHPLEKIAPCEMMVCWCWRLI